MSSNEQGLRLYQRGDSGYGYQVCIVEDLEHLDYELAAAMQWAVTEIRKIQTAARSGKPMVKPRWPLIILRTPKVFKCYMIVNAMTDFWKGLSGPKRLGDQPLEGSYKSHQIPIPAPAEKSEQLELLNSWFESYNPHEFFDEQAGLLDIIDKYVVPSSNSKKMGQRKETYDAYRPISLPDWKTLAKEKDTEASSTKVLGEYLRDVFKA